MVSPFCALADSMHATVGNFIHWQAEQLSAYSFTHIIIIDKHIQELYYPNQQPSIFKLCQRTARNQNNNDTRTGVGGTILVIDCNGGEQKCLTIIVAYLMYKYNINFRLALPHN
uniref:Uncharacterized protein n=1 Tax=Glossina austeni TaxID=7395 RepID=A0A1A9UCX4_GLOAU